jgi:hypothetical protein
LQCLLNIFGNSFEQHIFVAPVAQFLIPPVAEFSPSLILIFVFASVQIFGQEIVRYVGWHYLTAVYWLEYVCKRRWAAPFHFLCSVFSDFCLSFDFLPSVSKFVHY